MGGQGKTINRKRKFVGRKADDPEFDLDKKHFKVLHVNASEKRLIIVLEGAQLETVKVRKKEKNIWICAICVYHFSHSLSHRCTALSSCLIATTMRASCARTKEIRAPAGQTSPTNAC